GHASVLRQFFHAGLTGTAVLDGVVHPSQHTRRVAERFLVTDLRTRRIEICHVRALVVAGDLEGAARAGRRLLEDQADFLALEMLLLGARVLCALEIAREVEQVAKFPWRVILNRQQRAVTQIETHDVLLNWALRVCQYAGSREIGQVMQCPPPRPRPSSDPRTVITSIPALRSNVLVCVFRSYPTTTAGASATTLLPSSHCSRAASQELPPVSTTRSVLRLRTSLTTSKRCRSSRRISMPPFPSGRAR